MAALVVPSGGQLRLHWVMGTELAYNVLGLQIGAGLVVDQAMANALGQNVRDSLNTSLLLTSIDASTALTDVGVRDLRQANLPEFLATGFADMPGTDAGIASGYINSLCVTLRTAKAGKSYRGRVYLPVNAGTAIAEETGEYTQTATDQGRNFIQMLRQAISANAAFGGNLHLAVVSRVMGAETATVVTSEVVRSPILTTQKRRLPRRG